MIGIHSNVFSRALSRKVLIPNDLSFTFGGMCFVNWDFSGDDHFEFVFDKDSVVRVHTIPRLVQRQFIYQAETEGMFPRPLTPPKLDSVVANLTRACGGNVYHKRVADITASSVWNDNVSCHPNYRLHIDFVC